MAAGVLLRNYAAYRYYEETKTIVSFKKDR